MNINEHKFLADFQPFGDITTGVLTMIISTALNWAALFGVSFVIGAGIKLGLGS